MSHVFEVFSSDLCFSVFSQDYDAVLFSISLYHHPRVILSDVAVLWDYLWERHMRPWMPGWIPAILSPRCESSEELLCQGLLFSCSKYIFLTSDIPQYSNNVLFFPTKLENVMTFFFNKLHNLLLTRKQSIYKSGARICTFMCLKICIIALLNSLN